MQQGSATVRASFRHRRTRSTVSRQGIRPPYPKRTRHVQSNGRYTARRCRHHHTQRALSTGKQKPAGRSGGNRRIGNHPRRSNRVAPTMHMVITPNITYAIGTRSLLVGVINRRGSSGRSNHGPRHDTMTTPRTILLRTHGTRTTRLMRRQGRHRKRMMRMPRRNNVRQHRQLMLRGSFSRPRNTSNNSNRGTTARRVIRATRVSQCTPSQGCGYNSGRQRETQVNRHVRSLFKRLTVNKRNIEGFKIRNGRHQRSHRGRRRRHNSNTNSDGSTIAMRLVYCTGGRSQRNRRPTAPKVHGQHNPNNHITSVSLTNARDTFDMPANKSGGQTTYPGVHEQRNTQRPPPSNASQCPPTPGRHGKSERLYNNLKQYTDPQ